MTMIMVKITACGIPNEKKTSMPSRIANTFLVVNLKNICQTAQMNVISVRNTVHCLAQVFTTPSPIILPLFSDSHVPGFFLTSSKFPLMVTL